MPFIKGNKIGIGNKHRQGKIPWNKGKTKETDSRIKQYGLSGSKSKKGKHYSLLTEFKKGMKSIGGMLGKKHTEEAKRKISESHKGNKAYQWKGGITPERNKIRSSIDYRLWKYAVFARDNFTCQKTGIRGGDLVAHHIQNFAQYPELRFAIDNGITLSEKAHREFHRKYGIKNNTKEQMLEFTQLVQVEVL